MIFADSSALVTVYADEPQRTSLDGGEAVAIAEIARVEVPAALWRKQRMGELSVREARVLTDAFEADFFGTDDTAPRWVPVGTAPSVLDDAAGLVARHAIRAYDGVQLASALAIRRVDPECRSFAAFDRELRRAAAIEGFSLVPEEPVTDAGS